VSISRLTSLGDTGPYSLSLDLAFGVTFLSRLEICFYCLISSCLEDDSSPVNGKIKFSSQLLTAVDFLSESLMKH